MEKIYQDKLSTSVRNMTQYFFLIFLFLTFILVQLLNSKIPDTY